MSWLRSCFRSPKEVDEEAVIRPKSAKSIKEEVEEIVYPAITLTFGLLPELWERILLDLPPKDFVTAINTYPEWRKVVSAPKKAAKLFPMIFPFLIKYFPVNTFLNCRRISKETNNCLEEILEASLFPPEELDFNFAIPRKLSYEEHTRHRKIIYICFKARMEFTNSSSTARFRQHYLTGSLEQSRTLADSFMWRTISVDLDENVEDVLSRIGPHVRTLHMFQCKPKDLTSIRNVTCVLSLCTNIKSLKIRSSTRYTHREFNYNNQNFQVQFPKLPFFEELDVMGLHDTETEQFMRFGFFPLLEQYGRQLKGLRLSGHLLDLDFVTVQMLDGLVPNVKCLYIDSLSLSGIEKLAQVERWKPTELHIQPLDQNSQSEMEVKPILLFEETLVELHISLQYFSDRLELGGTYTQLKQLSIKVKDGEDLTLMGIWEFLPTTCPVLERIQFQTKVTRKEKPDVSLEKHRAKAMQTFRRLPSLTRVVVWYDRDQKVIRRPGTSQLAQ